MKKQRFNQDGTERKPCQRCGAYLNPADAVWLTLDQRTNTFTDEHSSVPMDVNQGGFTFGRDCANAAIKAHAAAQSARIADALAS